MRFVARGFYKGKLTGAVVNDLKPIVRRAFDDLFRQRAKHKIDVAFDSGADEAIPSVDETKVDTTEDEKHGFMIVRAIAAEVAPVSRIVMRDAQSYCAILFDDNNRKPIARLHFNGKSKSVTIFDSSKAESRHAIENIEDIFQFRDAIKTVVAGYNA